MLFLNEVYVGKTKELLEAEEILNIFRNKHMKRYLMNPGVNSDPDLLKFNRKMEDIFGFGCFTLYIQNVTAMNAMTIPVNTYFDVYQTKKDLVQNSNNFKFKKELDYCAIIIIYSGLIFNPSLKTSEVFAIILHEVGHNFQSSMSIEQSTFGSINKALIAIEIFLNKWYINILMDTNIYRKTITKYERYLREENNLLIYVYDFLVDIKSLGLSFVNFINYGLVISSLGTIHIKNALNHIKKYIYNIGSNPLYIFSMPLSFKTYYEEEEIADNFTTIHGYGADLISGLNKISSFLKTNPLLVIQAFSKIPVISQIIDINFNSGRIIACVLDEHPNEIIRSQDQIKLLERELEKNDLDPKMRKLIKKDIADINDKINDLIDTTNFLHNENYGRNLYNKIMKCAKIGMFKKSILGNYHKFEDYDKAFEKKINSMKG